MECKKVGCPFGKTHCEDYLRMPRMLTHFNRVRKPDSHKLLWDGR